MIENDPDILQALDESDLEWVNLWKLALDETNLIQKESSV
jgi:hypothetical protein